MLRRNNGVGNANPKPSITAAGTLLIAPLSVSKVIGLPIGSSVDETRREVTELELQEEVEVDLSF